MNKKMLVLGGGGFIGSNLVKKLKKEGNFVVAADLKYPEFSKSTADKFIMADLRVGKNCQKVFDFVDQYDEIYQLAADMGGAEYIFTGEHDADVMVNSSQININILNLLKKTPKTKIFFSSSACIYSRHNQLDPDNPKCSEETAYPADPDSEYGWEKLFSERLYFSFKRNYGLDVRVARFHNIFGPEGTWSGPKAKAPAAICRKVIESLDGGEIEIFGDGEQTRSFLFIDECLEGIDRFMNQDTFFGPVNIGSEEMITINNLAKMAMKIAGKELNIRHIAGPQGVRGRNSDNHLIRTKLDWEPTMGLKEGLEKTYYWIESQVNKNRKK